MITISLVVYSKLERVLDHVTGDRPVQFLLYKGLFPVSYTHPTLAVFGYGSAVLGSFVYHAEVAARWITKVFAGKVQLPPKKKMMKYAKENQEYFKRRCGGRIQVNI